MPKNSKNENFNLKKWKEQLDNVLYFCLYLLDTNLKEV